MSERVIFKDLPATFPAEDKYERSSFIGSVVFHGVLILAVVLVPLLLPQSISQRELLIALVAPIGPPPAPVPPPVALPAVAPLPKVVKSSVVPRVIEPGVLVMPTIIPKEVAKVIDEPVVATGGVVGGLPGGVPGAVIGGVLGNVLSTSSIVDVPAPAPPPPPPPPSPPKVVAPPAPVRVGGMVKEPRLLKLVPPMYPKLAAQARVTGTVVLEATVTAQGTVEEIHIVSGHPLLVQAAIDCVKQWQYEPTLLNGIPMPVILTAKVHFDRGGPLS